MEMQVREGKLGRWRGGDLRIFFSVLLFWTTLGGKVKCSCVHEAFSRELRSVELVLAFTRTVLSRVFYTELSDTYPGNVSCI